MILELKKDIKHLIEQTSNVIKKHRIRKLELDDWNSFDDPNYKEGKMKEKLIEVLEKLLEIEKDIELYQITKRTDSNTLDK